MTEHLSKIDNNNPHHYSSSATQFQNPLSPPPQHMPNHFPQNFAQQINPMTHPQNNQNMPYYTGYYPGMDPNYAQYAAYQQQMYMMSGYVAQPGYQQPYPHQYPPHPHFQQHPTQMGSPYTSNSTPSTASSSSSTPTTATTASTKTKNRYSMVASVATFKPTKSHAEHLEEAQKKKERSSIPSPSVSLPLLPHIQNQRPNFNNFSIPVFSPPYPPATPNYPTMNYGTGSTTNSHPTINSHDNNQPNNNNSNDAYETTNDNDKNSTNEHHPEANGFGHSKKPEEGEDLSLPFESNDLTTTGMPMVFGASFVNLNDQLSHFRELERTQAETLLHNDGKPEAEEQKEVLVEESNDTKKEIVENAKDEKNSDEKTTQDVGLEPKAEEKEEESKIETSSQTEFQEEFSPAVVKSPSPPPPAPVMAWSSMAQSAVNKKPKTAPVQSSKLSGNASPTTAIKKETTYVPSVSNALEPLGAVILKYVYDKSFKNKALISKLPKITPRGLVNTGNICFMSSILQLLLHCEPFYQSLHLIANKSIGAINIKDSKTPLFDSLVEFFKEFNQNQNEEKEFGENITPTDIYSAITAHNNFQHLQWGQQEDAEEFFGYLLDGLNEEFTESVKNLSDAQIKSLLNSVLHDETRNSIKASIKKFNSPELESSENNITTTTTVGEDGWHEVSSSKKPVSSSRREVEIKPSPINDLFGGQFRSILKVPREKHSQSITLDPFLQIQLDISDDEITSLTEAFKRVSTVEELPYKSNDGKDVIATKQTFIDRLPNVLIIHLKRFSFINKTNRYGRIEKIRKRIEYDEKLLVPPECLSPAIRNTSAEYKLIGVVYHHGLNSDGGHYTVDVLRNGSVNKWIRIDDTNIITLKMEDVLPNSSSNEESKTAYILMYQRVTA